VLSLRPHGGYDFISGNSIATAEVSGAISLLLASNQAARLKRPMDTDQVRDALIQKGLVIDRLSRDGCQTDSALSSAPCRAAMAVAEHK